MKPQTPKFPTLLEILLHIYRPSFDFNIIAGFFATFALELVFKGVIYLTSQLSFQLK